MASFYIRSSEDLLSHDLVREALLAGNYAVPRLPDIPVEKILDYAEYWKWVKCTTNRYACCTYGRHEYLRLSVPELEVCKKVKKVEIMCTSKYLGWSIYESINPNTHRNSWIRSWTWGEVSIFVTSSDGVKEFRQESLYTNLHATKKWKVYRCSFRENSEFVSSLIPGSTEIVLYLNAEFSMWQSYAKRATIKIMFV